MSSPLKFEKQVSIFEKVGQVLKKHFKGKEPTFEEVENYIWFVVLNGFWNESSDFFEEFAKRRVLKVKLPESKPLALLKVHWKTIQEKSDLSNGFEIIKKKKFISELGQKLVGHYFLEKHLTTLVQAASGEKFDANYRQMYLPSFTGLCYFLYFSSGTKETIDKKTGIESKDTRDIGFIQDPEAWQDSLKSEAAKTKKTEDDTETKQTRSTQDDFRDTYPRGSYHVEFMEEGSTIDNPKYAVSRLEFTKTSIIHYYQLLRSGRVVRTIHKVRDSSNRTSFHLYELDSNWGYRFSIPRTDSNESENNFWVLYEGVREQESTRFLGVGIARKIFSGDDTILPIRMVEALDTDHLRIAGDLETITQKFAQLRDKDADLRKAYNDLFNQSGKINSTSERILTQVTKLLDEKGPPIEVNDKGGIKFD